MRVEKVGDWGRPLEVTRLGTGKPDVLAAGDSFNEIFEVHGISPGDSMLRVRAKPRTDAESSDALFDFVRMRVSAIDDLYLSHNCTSEPVATYLKGSRAVPVNYWRYNAANELLVGTGPLPLEFTGGKLRKITNGHDVRVDLSEGKQRHTLTSSLSKRALHFDTVGMTDVDGLELSAFDKGAILLIGYESVIAFEPTVRGQRLCGDQPPVTARSLTPRICSVEDWEGFTEIKGLAYGLCKIEAHVPGGARSARATATIPVGTLPGDGTPDPRGDTLSADSPDATDASNAPRWLVALLALLTPLSLAPLLWTVGRVRRRED